MELDTRDLKKLKKELENLCGGKIKVSIELNRDLKIRRAWRGFYAKRPFKDTFSMIISSSEIEGQTVEDLRDIFWHALKAYSA